jgi:hypothetical protein
MQRLYFSLLLLIAIPLFAATQSTITVDQLRQLVESSIKQKLPDKMVADYLSHMKLTQKLDEDTVESLQDHGAGPKTVAALKSMITATAALPAASPVVEAPKPVQPPPPSYDEEQEVIHDMTDYALHYTQRLPDFVCTQVTRRSVDPRHRGTWQNYDTVVSRLAYTEGKEDYEVKTVNNAIVTNKSMESLNGSISTGEFGSLMREIFDEDSNAQFHFERWTKIRGQVNYVFAYQIEQPRSKFSIEYNHQDRIYAAYKGEVFVDKSTHKISRLKAEAIDIPASFPVKQARSQVDYDNAQIGPRVFLLPLTAMSYISDGDAAFKSDIEFRVYRKFGADTTITYDIPDPIDPAKQKEEPAPAPQ